MPEHRSHRKVAPGVIVVLQVVRRQAVQGGLRVKCAAHVAVHWGPVHAVLERSLVAMTIVAMLAIFGEGLDKVRLADVMAYAYAELITQLRLRL